MASKQHGERIEELRKDIETGVKELRNSGTWQRYLDFMGRFHRFAVRVLPPLGVGRNHGFLFFHITRNVVLLEI